MKKSSALTHKFKCWVARTLGIKVRCRGVVNSYDFTFGGAGNQWTTINDTTYGTYWDYRTKDWATGDLVEFDLFYAPLLGRGYLTLQADNIKKVNTDGTTVIMPSSGLTPQLV